MWKKELHLAPCKLNYSSSLFILIQLNIFCMFETHRNLTLFQLEHKINSMLRQRCRGSCLRLLAMVPVSVHRWVRKVLAAEAEVVKEYIASAVDVAVGLATSHAVSTPCVALEPTFLHVLLAH
jgi:hypothetical protein